MTGVASSGPSHTDTNAGGAAGPDSDGRAKDLLWVDTHCHLDAAEFAADRQAVIDAARVAGVGQIVIPAVSVENFEAVRELAQRIPGAGYALGIHPLATPSAQRSDIELLAGLIAQYRDDPKLLAVGEIGLDFFLEPLKTDAARATQGWFYREQLKLARRFGLPVLLHVRRSADLLLAGLRQIEVPGGIAHAFNGSQQQAEGFIARGLKLGFGGAMTFERALQIRRLASTLPDTGLVLETDAPDIAPAWLYRARNTPDQLPRIAQTLCALRSATPAQIAARTTANARAALPGLLRLIP